jgi:hypothetical protein
MSEMTIKLRIDPETGKKNIIVSLASDADSLPHEHEQQHRALVDKLIEGGLLAADEVGNVIVQREESVAPGNIQSTPEQSQQQSLGEGG